MGLSELKASMKEVKKSILAKRLVFRLESETFEYDMEEFAASKTSPIFVKKAKDTFEPTVINTGTDKFFLWQDHNSNIVISRNPNLLLKIGMRLTVFATRRSLIFAGIISNKRNGRFKGDIIYLNDLPVGKIFRPFATVPKLEHVAFVRVMINDILSNDETHNIIGVGTKGGFYIPLSINKKSSGGSKIIRRWIRRGSVLVARTTVRSKNIRISKIPFSEEYRVINLLKNKIAKTFVRSFGPADTILMFEKEANTAGESGIYIFSKIFNEKRKEGKKANVFFVLNKNNPKYGLLKREYGKNLIQKYSIRHYYHVYASKYFISSELSNHLFGARIYIKSLAETLKKKPLIFLQHGIMFAKPVDNPAAAGFHKSSGAVNVFKSVICSDLEATQFYKLGYRPEDLIKSGLPKFDVSERKENPNKTVVMLTYRFWEEAMTNREEDIKRTTYYKTYLNLIKIFEKNKMLDELALVCHPKFRSVLKESIPTKYKDIIVEDVNEAISMSRIFITDYSSASYDAHYRGSYVIYYWKERDYLIEKYKAVPPVNEDNADGPAVFTDKALIDEVVKAKNQNYVMDEKYERRYKKINEFSDNRNGDRLVEELKRLRII